jgi:putative transposase
MRTKVHKIKLNPNKTQELFFMRSCGVARFSYNWALEKWQNNINNGIKDNSAYTLIKELNSIKKESFPWMQDTAKTCSQYAIHNLEKGFKLAWKGINKYPKFRKKGKKDSFVAIENKESFKQNDFKLWIPRLGWVKCHENLRFEGKVNNVIIKRISDMWFAYININVRDEELNNTINNDNVVGLDLGINILITLSNGEIYQNPKALKSNLRSINRLQKAVSRKQKVSSNRKKSKIKLSKKYYKISCIRNNAINQATTDIVKKYNVIKIETLKPKEMIKNQYLSQSLSDVSFGEIIKQLEYKSNWYGKQLIKVDQWFPSSKLCSGCGNKKDKLSLSERIYKCESCGLEIDRDLNAAKNLASYSPTSNFEESEACGESIDVNQSTSMKQELNNFICNKNLKN